MKINGVGHGSNYGNGYGKRYSSGYGNGYGYGKGYGNGYGYGYGAGNGKGNPGVLYRMTPFAYLTRDGYPENDTFDNYMFHLQVEPLVHRVFTHNI